MKNITSADNGALKHVTALKEKARLRREEQVFLAEGLRLVSELPREALQQLWVTEEGLQGLKERVPALAASLEEAGDIYLTTSSLFKKISEVVSPQGVLAVARQFTYTLEDVAGIKSARGTEDVSGPKHVRGTEDAYSFGERAGAVMTAGEETAGLVLMLENVQDPGNMGTIFRSAEAAGASGLILSADCADPYNPKVVRSTMGALFRLPFVQVESMTDIIGRMKEEGYHVYASALDAAVPYTVPDYRGKSAFLIGNEGNGLKKETIEAAGEAVFIPMRGKTESLNASVSASLLLYEADRQRRL